MVFARYFFSRLCCYTLFSSLTLSILTTSIQFLEKLVRIEHKPSAALTPMFFTNLIPEMCNALPTAFWLGTCLVLRELYQHYEWQTLQLLTVSTRDLLHLALYAGLFFTISMLVLKETTLIHLKAYVDQKKLETFKQQSTNHTLCNRWYRLDHNLICHCDIIDLQTYHGSQLLLIYLDDNGLLETIIQGDTFFLDTEKKKLTVEAGIRIAPQQNTQTKFATITLPGDSLSTRIQHDTQTPTLFTQANMLIAGNQLSLPNLQRHLQINFFHALSYYLLLILYPALTIIGFVIGTPFGTIGRWAGMLAPYPLIMISSVACTMITHAQHHSAWILLIPEFFCCLLIAYWLMPITRVEQ